VTAEVVRALADDERAGARALADEFARRRARQLRERRRIRELFRAERELFAEGLVRLAGVDEVGMGPLAGPVIAAAVVLPPDAPLLGLRDSKQLSAIARERLDGEIRAQAWDVALGRADPEEIDRLNIYWAGLLAMQRAVSALREPPEMVLVDGRRIPDLAVRQRPVVGGDATVGSIAAASVVAKVCRDQLMGELDRSYPGYGFAHNAGYATAEHLSALARAGPTPVHRRSFAPVRAAARG
jgi:ribonuclease HII